MADSPARSLPWLGIPTDDMDAALRFFAEHLGLSAEVSEPDFAVLRLPSGQTVELFGETQQGPQLARGPVVGFEVDDVEERRAQMEAAGVSFIGPIHHGDAGRAWSHFTGPDGFVFELTQLAADERSGS